MGRVHLRPTRVVSMILAFGLMAAGGASMPLRAAVFAPVTPAFAGTGPGLAIHQGIGSDWSAQGETATEKFGTRVQTAGDVNGDGYADVLVGAPNWDGGHAACGRAYLFLGSANGLGAQPAWTFAGESFFGQMGYSLGTAGDVNGDGYADVVVSEYGYHGEGTRRGRALVFMGSAAGLAGEPAWSITGDTDNAWIGSSVGTAGDVNGDGFDDVFVGADRYTHTLNKQGRIEVYHGSANGLGAAPSWIAYGPSADAYLGCSATTAGDVNGDGFDDLLVGAVTAGAAQQGAAYVFHGSAGGLAEAPAWTGLGGHAGCYFGNSVAGAGDVNGDGYADVIVGAPFTSGGFATEGQVYVYHGSEVGVQENPAWITSGGQQGAWLGWAVAPAGDVNGDGYADVLFGAPHYSNGQNQEGLVKLYHGSDAGVSTTPAGSWEGNEADAYQGGAVAAAGDVNGDGLSDLVFGAPGSAGNRGRAAVYHGTRSNPGAEAAWSAVGGQPMGFFASSLAGAGDVNGDGYADLLVGASWYDALEGAEGAAWLFYGSRSGPNPIPNWSVVGSQPYAQLGRAVAGAGDVNGDGFDDIIIAEPGYDAEDGTEGRVLVFHGAAAGPGPVPAWSRQGPQITGTFGQAVAGAGDVNADGYADILIGDPDNHGGADNEGRAWLHLGSPSGLQTAACWSVKGPGRQAGFGSAVAGAGDVNGDGYGDVLVGAPGYTGALLEQGGAWLFPGSASGLSTTPVWSVLGNAEEQGLGGALAGAGDVNGDGFCDILLGVGEHGDDWEGAAFVYHGAAAWPAAVPAWTLLGDQASAHLGSATAGAGDVNGDGFSDVIVGAPGYEHPDSSEGAAFIFLGSAAGLAANPAWIAEGNAVNAHFGAVVCAAGDMNGDGFADVAVSSPIFRVGLETLGKAWFYLGGPAGGGARVQPRQWRANRITPLAILGRSDRQDAFDLSLRARPPQGPAKVKLEWEVAPRGAAYGDAAAIRGTSSVWSAAGPGGLRLFATVAGLTPEQVYHWRARIRYRPGNSLGLGHGPWFAANPNGPIEGAVRTVDLTSPTPVMTTPAPDPIRRQAAIPVTVTFNEPVTGFTASDVIVSNAALSGFSGSGASYAFTLTPERRGRVSADIGAGAAVDARGNPSRAALPLWRTHYLVAVNGDYDGDGVSDLAVFDSNTGFWYIRTVAGNAIAWAQPWGWPGAIPLPGDYDGDGANDLTVFDSNTGNWYAYSLSAGVLAWAQPWGWPGAVPVVGDYDADAISDLAVFDSNTGNWYAYSLSAGILAWAQPWGWPGAIPVSGDYNADWAHDLGVFDSHTGNWYIYALDGTVTAWAQPWGWPGAIPVSGDFDADGCDDLAVFDSNTGFWYAYSLSAGVLAWAQPWGWPGAVPVSGDFDGDRVSDLAVFDSASGLWYAMSLDSRILAWGIPWGWPGAIPVRPNL